MNAHNNPPVLGLADSAEQAVELETYEQESPAIARHPNMLTDSDKGRLPERARRALVQLLKGPYLSQERHSKIWAALLQFEDDIRERLGDLFCELVLDLDVGIAFVRNMESAELELPKVIRSQRLTLIDTALVLLLREQLLHAEGSGRRVFIGRVDISDNLSVYRNHLQVDEPVFNKRVGASIEKMKNQSVLLPTKEEERFEISPILGLVFDADQVLAVTGELKRLITATDKESASGESDEADAEVSTTLASEVAFENPDDTHDSDLRDVAL
jgi:hypothetical protein